jgi:hypothetical protein
MQSGTTIYCAIDDSHEARHREVVGPTMSLEGQRRWLQASFNQFHEQVMRREREQARLHEIPNYAERLARSMELSIYGHRDEQSYATFTESVIPRFNARCLEAGRRDLLLPDLRQEARAIVGRTALPSPSATKRERKRERKRLRKRARLGLVPTPWEKAKEIADSLVARAAPTSESGRRTRS